MNPHCNYVLKVANIPLLGVLKFFPRSESFLSGLDSQSDGEVFPAGKTVFCRVEDFLSA